MSIARRALLWASQNRWLERQMRRRAFARRAVRRFMPGEDLDAALGAAAGAASAGIGSIITQLGENITSEAEATAVRDHYLDVLAEIERRGTPSEVSVKPTQLGLDIDPEACARALMSLAERAAQHESRLWIDMEDSRYVDRTLDLYRRVKERFPALGLCLQAYLYRTPDDLASLLPLDPCIRLVKGAYNEAADVAFPKKSDVDAAFRQLGETLIAHAAAGGRGPVLGTHDLTLVDALQQHAARAGLDKRTCEVHMLYGIATAGQRRLADAGYDVRVLISYGTAWFRWYMRRLAERPANVWFVAKSVFG